MNEKRVQVSNVFRRNKEAYENPDIKIITNVGGTRSTKTYSISQLLTGIYSYYPKKKSHIIDIARKTQTELRDTVYTDFIEILENMGLYQYAEHNKTRMIIDLFNVRYRFIGLDRAQKKRGAKRDDLYINEANDLTLEDWLQLLMRTKGKIFIDFNPSEEFWYHDHVEGREDNLVIHSTYKDNPFLPEHQVKEIERLIEIDDYYYKVYVLGELAELRGRIYNQVKTISEREFNQLPTSDICFAIDWGFNDPMVLVESRIYDGQPYYKELYYKSEQRPKDLIKFMQEKRIGYDTPIYCDPSQPSSIEDFQLNDFPAMRANNDILDGIKNVKKHGLRIVDTSTNLLKERKLYKFHQDKNGKFIDKPVDLNNHALDCVRYIANTHETLRYRA